LDEPDHRFGTNIFNCMLAESHIRKYLISIGVKLIFENRAVDVEVGKSSKGIGNRVLAVTLQKGQRIEADAFVDTTGGAGGVQICVEHGYGCVECSLRCNSFGDRVSIATKAGAPELKKLRDPQHGGGFGAISSACSFYDDSVDPKLLQTLKQNGSWKMDVPQEVRDSVKLGLSTNLPFDPSHISTLKMTYPGFFKANGMVYMPLEDVRKIPGLENARFSDPLGGSRGNAVRFISMAPRENSMRVFGFSNLFVGGEKSGPLVGIQEAVVSGALAGYNAARAAFGKDPLTLPPELVLGDFFAFIQERMQSERGLMEVYGGMKPTYRKRMDQKGWWAKTVQEAIDSAKQRVTAANLSGVMAQRLAA
jgi:Glucose inhibited division protein A